MNHRRGKNICHSRLHSMQHGAPLKNCNNFPYCKHQAIDVHRATACGLPVLVSASQNQPQTKDTLEWEEFSECFSVSPIHELNERDQWISFHSRVECLPEPPFGIIQYIREWRGSHKFTGPEPPFKERMITHYTLPAGPTGFWPFCPYSQLPGA